MPQASVPVGARNGVCKDVKKQGEDLAAMRGERLNMLKNMRDMNARIEKMEMKTVVSEKVLCSVIGVQRDIATGMDLTNNSTVMMNANVAHMKACEAGMKDMRAKKSDATILFEM